MTTQELFPTERTAHGWQPATPENLTAENLRDLAIEQGRKAANKAWLSAAVEVVRSVARRMPVFTMDDVAPVLELLQETTHDNRARSGLMLSARKAGICEATDATVTSTRPETHAKWIRVYRSLICDGQR